MNVALGIAYANMFGGGGGGGGGGQLTLTFKVKFNFKLKIDPILSLSKPLLTTYAS